MALAGKGALVVGLVIAVVGGLGLDMAWFGWVLAALGLIVGYVNVSDEESHSFLVAAIALILAAGAIGAIPVVGGYADAIIANLVVLLGGAVLVVALKGLFATAKD